MKKQNGLPLWQPVRLDELTEGYFFFTLTAALRTAPALNAARLPAGIWIFWRVLGFVPTRAAVLRTSNVPKPVSVTFSPDLRAAMMASIVVLMTLAVSA